MTAVRLFKIGPHQETQQRQPLHSEDNLGALQLNIFRYIILITHNVIYDNYTVYLLLVIKRRMRRVREREPTLTGRGGGSGLAGSTGSTGAGLTTGVSSVRTGASVCSWSCGGAWGWCSWAWGWCSWDCARIISVWVARLSRVSRAATSSLLGPATAPDTLVDQVNNNNCLIDTHSFYPQPQIIQCDSRWRYAHTKIQLVTEQ